MENYIPKFSQFLNESSADKIFFERDHRKNYTLWLSHSPNNGTTEYYEKDRIFKKYLHDYVNNQTDDKYDPYTISGIINCVSILKPIKNKDLDRVYKIPVFDYSGESHANFEIWGGTQSPTNHIYLTISTNEDGENIIAMFPTRKEAVSFQ